MRAVISLRDQLVAIQTHLDSVMGALSHPVPSGLGERPKTADAQFIDAPYFVIGVANGGTLDGPLDDTQADSGTRIWVTSYGNTADEAYVVRDLVHAEMMDKSNFSITGRVIMDIRLETPSDGAYRDDDVQTPLFYTRQIYVLRTTPA